MLSLPSRSAHAPAEKVGMGVDPKTTFERHNVKALRSRVGAFRTVLQNSKGLNQYQGLQKHSRVFVGL